MPDRPLPNPPAALARRLARAGGALALALAAVAAQAQCGPFGAAAEYPAYGINKLDLNVGTVGNGSATYAFSGTSTGTGLALNENNGQRVTASLALPALNPAAFPALTGTTDVKPATSLTPGTYKDIEVASNTTLTFAPGTYYLNKLTVKDFGSVVFGLGTYFIGEIDGGKDATYTISPATGNVRLNIGSKVQMDDRSRVNVGGSPAAMQIFAYPNKDLIFKKDVVVSALLYAPGASSKIEFDDRASFTGAAIGHEVKFQQQAVISYPPSAQAAIAAVDSCQANAPVQHYELALASSSLACLPTTVTVTACRDASSPCTAPATDQAGKTATLATSAGTLGASTVSFNAAGVATTTLTHPGAVDGGTVTVTLSGEQTAASAARQCCPDGIGCSVANSCSTVFSTAGFIVAASAGGAAATVPSQTAGTTSGSFFLRAVRTNTTTKACEAGLSGATTVDWGYRCNNPATCSASNLMTLNGGTPTQIQRNNAAGALATTPVPMTFDANGNAPFGFTFADVGQVTLQAQKTVGGATLSGASNAFVVRPGGFTVGAIAQTAAPNVANPAAASAAGAKFVQAGEPFGATVTARTSGGAATPNFGKESPAEGVRLTAALVLPAGGAAGTLANATVPGASFSGGAATVANLSFSEVGIVTLTPSVADGDYLGAGNVTGTPTGNVGRFVPARFALTGGGVTHRAGLACTPASAFSYLGENFRLGFTLTAQNTAGATTQNYAGAFAKLDPANGATWNLAGRDGATAFSTGSGRLSVGSAAGSWAAGVASGVTLTAAALRGSAPDGPFNAAFGIAPVDADGVALAAYDLDTDTTPGNDRASVGSVALAFGRLQLASAIGAADRPLALPVAVQAWNGSAFADHAADSCTAVPVSAISFGNLRRTVTTADTAATGPIVVSAGRGVLRLAAPGGGRSGTYDVALSLGAGAADGSCLQPWTPGAGDAATAGGNLAFLRGAWCGGGFDKDPAARASFGLPGGAENSIYRRENY